MAIREKVILEGEESVSDAARRAEGGVSSFDTKLKALATAGGLAIAVRKAGELAVALTGMAIDADEAASAFDTTFGPSVDGVTRFVDEFANKAGFAEHELKQMLATTGAVAQGIGATEAESASLATEMARLAGDVASFSNATGGAEAVLAALQSSMSGEREALKTYGIAISEAEVQERALQMTQKDRADELTRLEKAEATLAIATEKAGKQVGDLDRTSESAANKIRALGGGFKDAGVEIGETLIPSLEAILPAVEGAIPAVERLGEQLASTIAAAAPPDDDAAAGWDDFAAKGVDAITYLNANLTAGFAQVGLAAGDFIDHINIFGELEDPSPYLTRLRDTNRAIADLVAVSETFRQGNYSDGIRGVAEAYGFLADRGTLTESTIADVNDIFGISGFTAVEAAQFILDYGNVTDETGRKALEAAADLSTLTGETTYAANAYDEINSIGRQVAETQEEVGGAVALAADGFRRGRQVVDDYTQSILDAIVAGDTFAQAQLAAAEPVFGAIDAWQRYQEAVAAAADTESDAGAAMSDEELLEVADAALQAQAAVSDLSPEQLEGFMRQIAEATGVPIERVEELLANLEEIDGRTFRAAVEVDNRYTPVRTVAGGPFHTGGTIGGTPGSEQVIVAQAGELVIPNSGADRDTFRDLVSGLARQIAATTDNRRPSTSAGAPITFDIDISGTGAVEAAEMLQYGPLAATIERLAGGAILHGEG